MLFISGKDKQVEPWYVMEEAVPILTPLLEQASLGEPYEELIINSEEKNRSEMDAFVPLPLFRATGTSMEIENLYKKLHENDQRLRGGNSYHQKPSTFETQWKTRIGKRSSKTFRK